LLKEKIKEALWILITHLVLLISYFRFTVKHQLQGYASRYNLSLAGIAGNFMAAPLIVKLLCVFAVLLIFYIIYKMKKERKLPLEALFIPLGYLCYIAVLLPWGIISYHISVTAPYVLGMFFPLYAYGNGKSRLARFTLNLLLCLLCLLAFLYIIKPRIVKIANIKKTVVFLKGLAKEEPGARYFFPPPYSESAYSMSVFTGQQITYVENGVLSANMLGDGIKNFLMFDDQDPVISLSGVDIQKEIYRNATWRVYAIRKAEAPEKRFKVEFNENFLEKLKTYLKEK